MPLSKKRIFKTNFKCRLIYSYKFKKLQLSIILVIHALNNIYLKIIHTNMQNNDQDLVGGSWLIESIFLIIFEMGSHIFT